MREEHGNLLLAERGGSRRELQDLEGLDEEEQAYRARTGQDRIAKAIAARGAWFPGD